MLAVTFGAQSAGLTAAAVVVVVSGSPLSGAGWAWGLAAGAIGCLSLLVFYRALARGVMSLVAPVSAAGALIPIGVGLAGGEDVSALALAGMALALLGAVGCGLAPGRIVLSREALGLAVLAAVGIGVLLTLLAKSAQADGSSGLGAVLAARVAGASVTGAGLLALRGAPLRRALETPRAFAVPLMVGVLDTAANAAFAVASEDEARTAVVALLGSLYPLATLLLARLVLSERLSVLQAVAAAGAIGGAAIAGAA